MLLLRFRRIQLATKCFYCLTCNQTQYQHFAFFFCVKRVQILQETTLFKKKLKARRIVIINDSLKDTLKIHQL